MSRALLSPFLFTWAVISFSVSACTVAQTPISLANKIDKSHPVITLDTTFLFEKHIESYNWGDQIIENRGLIINDNIELNTYKKLYFLFSLKESAYKNLGANQRKWMRDNLRIDKKTVEQTNFDLDIRDSASIEIRPFYGTSYVPCSLKVQLYYVGRIAHRVPLFLDRKGYELYKAKHNGKNYTIEKLHTYLIIKVY